MKKTFVSIFIALLLLVLVVSVAFAAQPTGKRHIHFEGTMQSVETDEVLNPTIYLHANGSADATELGQFTLHFEGIIYRDPAVGGVSVEAEHLTMANGDKIFATATGLGVVEGDNSNIVENFTITGGTGQFEDASGKYIVERVVNRPTGASSGTIEGNIKLSKDK